MTEKASEPNTPRAQTQRQSSVTAGATEGRDGVRGADIAQRIASGVGRDVDLVDLGRASTVMAARVVAHDQRLLCVDAGTCAAFEAHALADYARLNEERRDS